METANPPKYCQDWDNFHPNRKKALVEKVWPYDKMHAQQELTYIKYACFFICTFVGFMLIEEKGLVGDYIIALVCTGFGALCASFLVILFTSSEINWKHSVYDKEGETLEEKHQLVINFNYFKVIGKLNTNRYRARLLARLTLFTLIGGLTI